MNEIVIKAEKLSKIYKLGDIGTGTLSHDLNRWWARMRGKEDPFLKIESAGKNKKGPNTHLALDDINFEITEGTAVGIIGKNGAGKSTLLKILSQVTTPSSGTVKVRGRIASLLEVGTGFHPDLSGRENIFLNGAILGMTKHEIKNKFDEIVSFAGVEKYIDTPVKRYSSGMYVRLAFAIAAHLEPEILIVDEVLAVGDAEFQKKCLGKMGEVSKNEGRTVLFVSHNITAVQNLCKYGIYLETGKIKTQGKIEEVIEKYQRSDLKENNSRNIEVKDGEVRFISWNLNKHDSMHTCYTRETVGFIFKGIFKKSVKNVQLGFVIRNLNDDLVISVNSIDLGANNLYIPEGEHDFIFDLLLPLKAGIYQVEIAIVDYDNQFLDHWIATPYLNILSVQNSIMPDKWQGIVNTQVNFSWRTC